MKETKELKFAIPHTNNEVVVKVTVHSNLMGKLTIITQIGDEPPMARITDESNTNIIKPK